MLTISKKELEKRAKMTICQAVRYPERARLAADAIVKDICDRGGMKQFWSEIDANIRYEIIETWVKIIEIVHDIDFDVNELLEERKKTVEEYYNKINK